MYLNAVRSNLMYTCRSHYCWSPLTCAVLPSELHPGSFAVPSFKLSRAGSAFLFVWSTSHAYVCIPTSKRLRKQDHATAIRTHDLDHSQDTVFGPLVLFSRSGSVACKPHSAGPLLFPLLAAAVAKNIFLLSFVLRRSRTTKGKS